jgi:starvation-inducible DNA-binding protein
MGTATMEKAATAPTRQDGRASKTATRPAPRQLATPTDLSPDGVRAITEALNGLVADAFALYVKTKNYHWHLASSHFRDYHLLFDEQADQIFATIDPLAERVRKIGGTTIRSIGHIGSLQSVEDSDEDFVAPADMVRRLMEDNKSMAASMRKAHETCDEYKDVATASVLEVFIDETERRTWFLFEVAQSGEEPTR